MMLENIRFNEGEESNDSKFSKKISNLGDIYVNDAFLALTDHMLLSKEFQNIFLLILGYKLPKKLMH